MSAAKKCDRCGAFYEQHVVNDISIKKYVHGYGVHDIDLCPDCHAEFEAFLDNQSVVLAPGYTKHKEENK